MFFDQNILIVSCFTLLIYYWWCRRKFYLLSWKLKSISTLGYPVLGLALNVRKQENILSFAEDLRMQNKSAEKIHTIIWFGPLPFYYVSVPEYIKRIFTSTNFINKVNYYDIFTKHFGYGMISSKSPVWNYHRKKLNPAFNIKILKSFQPIFNKEIDKLCNKMNKLVGNGEVDIMSIIQLCALDITCQTTMGKVMNFQQNENDAIVQSYYNISKATVVRIFNPLYHNDFIFKWTKIGKICKNSQRILKQFVTNLLENKLLTSESVQEDGHKITNDSIKTSNIFIDQTIELLKTKEFTWEDAIDESNAIVFAGYETSANTLSYTIMCLAMFPEYQEKLFTELYQVFPQKHNFNITNDDLEKLEYTEMVINENMRLMAPVPLVGREAKDDYEIDEGIILPKGTQIVIDIFNMHRDEKIWGENAKIFFPDHFLPQNINKVHPYAFIPFTKGHRTCIGSRYAILALKTMLAKIIRQYRFTTKFNFKDLHFVENITMKLNKIPLLEIHERLY